MSTIVQIGIIAFVVAVGFIPIIGIFFGILFIDFLLSDPSLAIPLLIGIIIYFAIHIALSWNTVREMGEFFMFWFAGLLGGVTSYSVALVIAFFILGGTAGAIISGIGVGIFWLFFVQVVLREKKLCLPFSERKICIG